MVIIPTRVPRKRKVDLSDSTVVENFAYIENGIVDIVNDTQTDSFKESPTLYLRKVEGCSVEKAITGVTGRSKGAAVYVEQDASLDDDSRTMVLVAYNNKILGYRKGRWELLRDVETEDSYSVDRISFQQFQRYGYISINDPTMLDEIYLTKGTETGDITAAANGGSGEVDFTSTAHGFTVGQTIEVSGTTSYDGTYTIVGVPDADTFSVTATYVADETGTWSGVRVTVQTESGMGSARLLGKADNSLVAILGGVASAEAIMSEKRLQGLFDDFVETTQLGGPLGLSGLSDDITATDYASGYTILAERDRLTFHRRKTLNVEVSSSIQQDSDTMEDVLTTEGVGTESPDGLFTSGGNVFVADDQRKCVWRYSLGSRPKLENLSLSASDTFRKFDMSNAQVIMDEKNQLLLCWVSTIVGGSNNRLLIYNLRTDKWSFDTGKPFSDPVWDPILKKVYAFDRATPQIVHVYDGTHSNLGNQKIRVKWRTRPINGGDEYILKEYDSSSIKFGYVNDTQEVMVNYYVDERGEFDISETKALPELSEAVSSQGAGAWGQYSWGSGGGSSDVNFIFKRYLNQDAVSDFSRLTIEVIEESSAPFICFDTKVRVIPTTDESDDFE